MDQLVNITAVEVVGDHRLRLAFQDGVVGDVALGEHEWRGVFEPLRDQQRFARVCVEYGTVTWPEDGLDMAPEPLYEEVCQQRVSAGSASK